MSPGYYLTPGPNESATPARLFLLHMNEGGRDMSKDLFKQGLPCVWDVMLSRQVSRGRLRHRARTWCLWLNLTSINWSRRCDVLFYVYFVLRNVSV